MENHKKINYEKRRKIIGKAIIIFFSIMLIITFFSKTIQNILLPGVIVTKPHPGILVYEAWGTGTIIPRETLEIYPESVKKVKEIKIQAGNKVKKGQVLAVLSSKPSGYKLAEQELELKILKNKLEKLLLDTEDSQQKVLQLEVEKALDKKISLQNELKKIQKLLKAGAVTNNQFADAKYKLELAQKDYEQKKIELENKKEKQLISRHEKGKEIDILRQQIKLKQIKLEQLKEEEKIISPFEGIVKEIYYQKGQLALENQPICSLINSKKGFVFSVSLKRDEKKFISVGDTITVVIKSKNKAINRPIEKIIFQGDNKKIMAVINETNFQGGEKFEYRIIKKSNSFNTIIPNVSLGQDNKGYFIYRIKERDGALGKKYYVEKQYITIGDSDNRNTVVLTGLDNKTSIVYSSEKLINDGNRVWPQ